MHAHTRTHAHTIRVKLSRVSEENALEMYENALKKLLIGVLNISVKQIIYIISIINNNNNTNNNKNNNNNKDNTQVNQNVNSQESVCF